MSTCTVTLQWDQEGRAEVHSGGRDSIPILQTDDGDASFRSWPPEALLAASVGSGLLQSVRTHLKSDLSVVRSYLGAAEATVSLTRAGSRIRAVSVSTVIGVVSPKAAETVRAAVAMAESGCAVSHSLDCPVSISWEINVVGQDEENRPDPFEMDQKKEFEDAHLRVSL